MSRTYRQHPWFNWFRHPRHRVAKRENEKHNEFRRPKAIPPDDWEDITYSNETNPNNYIRRSLRAKTQEQDIIKKVSARYRIPYPEAVRMVENIKKWLY